MNLWKKTILVGGAVLGLAMGASAHIPQIEPQALYVKPKQAPADSDASFTNPFQLAADATVSQAIFAYLTKDDVDVFQVNVAPQDVQFGPKIIAASALPPACEQTKHDYPATALIGFGLPPAPAGLPFAVPPGMGAVVAYNPVVDGPREVFHAEGDLNLSWYLPAGLSENCLLHAPWTCDFSNTISQPVFVPGTYYIAMWDPQGKAMDYTANIGFVENGQEGDPEVQDLVRDNGLLHGNCTHAGE